MKAYPLLNYMPCHEDEWGIGGIAPHILNLGTRWRWVVSFMPCPVYHSIHCKGGRGVGPSLGLDTMI